MSPSKDDRLLEVLLKRYLVCVIQTIKSITFETRIVDYVQQGTHLAFKAIVAQYLKLQFQECMPTLSVQYFGGNLASGNAYEEGHSARHSLEWQVLEKVSF